MGGKKHLEGKVCPPNPWISDPGSSFPQLCVVSGAFFSNATSKSFLIFIPLICTWVFIHMDFTFWSDMDVQELRKGEQDHVPTVTPCLPPKSRWETGCEAVYGSRAQGVGIFYPLLQFPMLGCLFHLKKSGILLDFTEDLNIFSHPRKECCPLGWSEWLWIRDQGFGCLSPAVFMAWDNPQHSV